MPPSLFEPVFLRNDRKLINVAPHEIILLETNENYTRIYLKDVYYMVRTTMSAALKKLPPEIFVQISRSVSVSILYIKEIEKGRIIMIDEIEFTIERKYNEEVMKKLVIIGGSEGE